MCLLVTVTPLAFATDYLLAYSELNAWHGGAYVEWPRLFFCLSLAFACVVLTMVAGIGIPAYQAMRVPTGRVAPRQVTHPRRRTYHIYLQKSN